MAKQLIAGKSAEVLGVKELVAKVNDIARTMRGERTGIGLNVHQVLGRGADQIKTLGQSKARAQGWPKIAADSFFTFADPQKARRGRATALVGVGKKRSMVEWTARPNPKSPRAKVGPGGKVAMSLATMFEFGRIGMSARPAFVPAVKEGKGAALREIETGLRQILDQFTEKV